MQDFLICFTCWINQILRAQIVINLIWKLPKHFSSVLTSIIPLIHSRFHCGFWLAGHVYADSDSAEDIVEDSDAAVDEEEDDEDVLVEEDQIQTSVCTVMAQHD